MSETFPGNVCFCDMGLKHQKQLFMARDRLGKKPLVYFYQNGHFAFASEIKALLQIPEVERKVNMHGSSSLSDLSICSVSRYHL